MRRFIKCLHGILLAALTLFICSSCASLHHLEDKRTLLDSFVMIEVDDASIKSTIESEYTAIQEDPCDALISSFDVREDGMIAVGRNGPNDRAVVCVYSGEGVFLYGFQFQCSGTIYVNWWGEELTVFYVRSGFVAFFEPGSCSVSRVEEFSSVNDETKYINCVNTGKKQVGDSVYSLKYWFISVIHKDGYMCLVRSNGENKDVLVKTDLSVIGEIAVLVAAIFVFLGFISWKTAQNIQKNGWGKNTLYLTR